MRLAARMESQNRKILEESDTEKDEPNMKIKVIGDIDFLIYGSIAGILLQCAPNIFVLLSTVNANSCTRVSAISCITAAGIVAWTCLLIGLYCNSIEKKRRYFCCGLFIGFTVTDEYTWSLLLHP